MQLENLVKPLDQMTEEELHQRIRELRNNRNTVRPAAQNHTKRAAKKGAQKRISKVEKLLQGMSRDDLIKLLGGNDGSGES